MENHYKTLGVSEDDNIQAIKKAYKDLAKIHHPDIAKDDGEAMKPINEAYDILKDPQKKAEYDQIRQYSQGPTGNRHHQGPFGGFNVHMNNGNVNMDEILRQAMGAGFNSPFQRQPINRDINMEFGVTLEEAFAGKTVKSSFDIENEHREVTFELEAGVNNGDRIRIKGAGLKNHPSLPAGDLFIHVRISPHQTFKRKGQNLHALITIDALDAMIGSSNEITNIEGKKINLKVPAGTQPGSQLRMRGQGFSVRGIKARGDLFVTVAINIPQALTPQEEALLKQVKELRQKA